MTPNQRLDQLEPLMAESLQKIDRLIEGQGQILEIATRADQKADTTAKGLANLTVQMGQQFDKQQQQIDELRQEMREGFMAVDQKFDQVNQKFDQVNLKIDYEIGSLRQDMNHEIGSLRQEMNQRFDQLVTLIQDRLK
ncbi:hypothetical protein [Spirosoma gilvum]